MCGKRRRPAGRGRFGGAEADSLALGWHEAGPLPDGSAAMVIDKGVGDGFSYWPRYEIRFRGFDGWLLVGCLTRFDAELCGFGGAADFARHCDAIGTWSFLRGDERE